MRSADAADLSSGAGELSSKVDGAEAAGGPSADRPTCQTPAPERGAEPPPGRDRRRALTEHEIAALRLMLVGPFERVAVLGGWSWRQNGRTISRRTAMQLVRRRLAMVVGDCLAATGKAALLLRRHRSAAPTLYGYNRAPIGGQIARQA